MDIKLSYTEQGRGEPLFLLHGNGEDHHYFQHQIKFFCQYYRIIAVDTRGHGSSPRGTAPFTIRQFADDLYELFGQLEITKGNILGFSDGGITALIFALTRPERVNKLILNGANLDPEGVVEPLRTKIQEKAKEAAQTKDESAENMQRYENLRLMAEQPSIDPKELSKVEAPTLVIVGTQDLIEGAHTKLIYSSLPNAELVFVQGDHFIAYDNPVAFNEAVDKFLKEF